MARNWKNDATNWEAASSSYPDGKIKDDSAPGAGDGTLINEVLHGDVMQFFLKLMSDAGLTANGNPDNETNGYQFIQALEDKLKVDSTGWLNITAGSGVTLSRGKVIQYGKTVTITGAFALTDVTAGLVVFTLPSQISTTTVDIDFIAGAQPSSGEEVSQLFVDAYSRNVRLRETGNTPNSYSFCVTYTAL